MLKCGPSQLWQKLVAGLSDVVESTEQMQCNLFVFGDLHFSGKSEVSIMCDKCAGESRLGNITFDYCREYCT